MLISPSFIYPSPFTYNSTLPIYPSINRTVHPLIYLTYSFTICLLTTHLPTHLLPIHQHKHLSICVSTYSYITHLESIPSDPVTEPFIYISTYPSIGRSVYISTYSSTGLPIYIFIYLTMRQPIYIFTYSSTYPTVGPPI